MEQINDTFNTINGGVHTFSINFLGSTVIYTMEPENVKTVFATNHRDYGIPQTRKDSLGIFGPGIFTSDGKHWEASRGLLRPNFVRSQVGDMPALERHVSALIGKIPRDGRTIEMQELFADLTMDSATELFLGESTGILQGNEDPRAVRFHSAFGYVSECLSVRMGIGKLASLIPDRKFYEGVRDLKAFIDIYVSRALDLRKKFLMKQEKDANYVEEATEDGRYVFLPELAKSGYDKERIAAELMNIITAGRGSITSLLAVFWYTIARRPDILEKLQQEVFEMQGDRPPSFEELKSLKYLGWTLRESKL
jgi:cytochrome P450